jgi:amino acid adenylation domain-containing protein
MDPERNLSYNPLFQVMFSFMDTPTADLRLPGLELYLEPSHNRSSKFDLNIVVVPPVPPDQEREGTGGDDGETLVEWEYNTDIFDDSTMDRMLKHYTRLLEEIINYPGREISALSMMGEIEINQLLVQWNRTGSEYPRDKSLGELFSEQAARTPDGVSAVGGKGGVHITYGVLNEKAGRLAHFLKEKGVLADSIVGIMVKRSVEMIIGILGILKAGGAYLPIDTEYPQERIDYMLKDSGARILLTNLFEGRHFHHSLGRLTTHHSGNLAYVIYTSGSTGRPKGVMLEHGNVVNFIYGIVSRIDFSAGKTILALTTISFDIFVLETLLPLLNGLGVIMVSEEEQKDPRLLARVIVKNGVNMLQVTPSSLKLLLKHDVQLFCLENIEELMVGGEGFPRDLFEILKSKYNGRIYNMYGPTETTVWSTVKELTGEAEITVGIPIANTQIYIIGPYKNLQPVGVVGELCIDGEGLARGYVNRPELTAEKFDHDKKNKSFCGGSRGAVFSKRAPLAAGGKIYKTGDLARWQPGGNIELIGRVDHQVKIRGFRIEPGEIEGVLLKHRDINEAVVECREDESGDRYLCAYVVPHCPGEYREEDVYVYLSESLPGYMVPSYIMMLEAMPLNPSGKVDRKSLPGPAIRAGNDYAPPGNELEVKLVRLWSEILDLDEGAIGIDNNFFRLGGHSLKAVGLMNRIHKELSVEVPVSELFKTPTVRGLAGYVRHSRLSPYSGIKPVEKKEYYGLSPAQKRLYILQQMAPDSTGYNLTSVLSLKEDVNRERLEKAAGKLISRHESLRTFFEMKEDEPVQGIHEKNYKFQITNITGDFVQCFDLSKAPLLRVGLIKVEEAKHFLMVDMHHIITDNTSREILTGELMSLYSHPGEELSPLPLHYKDYAEWQNSREQQELIKRQETYWLELFPGDLPVLNLPFDYPRPVLQGFAGSRIHFALDEEETGYLKTMARESGSTLYITILSLFSILLSKLSGEEDIIIGTPVAGRQHPDTEKIVGMFVNTLAMRNYPAGDKTFKEFLEEVKNHTLAAYDNQGYPFEELVEKISVHRDTGRNPVFDVMFNLLNQTGHTGSILWGDEDSGAYFERVTAKFDLNLTAIDLEETLSFRLEYCTELFKKKTIERFTRYFREILTPVLVNTGQRIMDMEILPASERMLLLKEFNDTAAQYPQDKTIHDLFAEQAARTPDSIAVVGAHENITYRRLNHKSDRLARLLKEKGVLADSIVGIMAHRSIEMITGILGILKAGGAYLPIDPDYPRERIDYMLKDSNAGVLLTNLPEGNHFHHSSFINHHWGNLAYIIYTSGTTGRPKGVMVKHGNVINLVFGLHRNIYLQYPDNLRVALVSPFVFDASVKQVFAVLLLGHTLCIVGEETRIDSKALKEFYHRYCIDISDGTPIHLHLLAEDSGKVNHMKHFIIGGEALPPQTVKDFFSRCGTPAPGITNVYGPSECCVDSTWYEILKETVDNIHTIPIGKPMPNEQIYIVSQHEQLQPIGVPGELCISGDGVGRGYLNQPELTAEKFCLRRPGGRFLKKLPPWTPRKNFSLEGVPGSQAALTNDRLYRTGDLGRWLADGNIEFLGRKDRQVKIRGFRLELEEIENELLKIPPIKEAAVISRCTAPIPDTLLCAYVVSDKTVNPFEIKETLSSRLPGYAVPSTIAQIDRIPLTPNGKVNRHELPELQPIEGQEEYLAPTDPTELKLAELWSELLGQDKIAVTDNFFQSGGHSLRAIILVSRIRKLFNVHITLADIFTMPTVRLLSGYIRGKEKSPWTAIKPVEEKEYYACTSAQKRLYILQQKDQTSTAYNMPYAVIMEGPLDMDRPADTFQRLVKRHDSLRTFFAMKEKEPVQRIHRENYKLQITNYKQIPGSEYQIAGIIDNFVRPFDLSKAPLLRVALIKIEAEKHLLAVDMHHTISDGISRSILVKEFTALYSREELPVLHLQYKDYSEWQNSPGQKENIPIRQEYWLKQFRGDLPVLALPTDYPGSEVSSPGRQTMEFDIEEEDMRALKKLAFEESTTLYTILFTVYYVFLSKITGQEDIVVGTPAAGRTHTGLEPLIGMFVNTLALRNYPTGEKTFRQFLTEVKQNALQAFEYQDYPLEDLVDRVAKDRNSSRNPLFNVMFTLSNVERSQLEIPGLKLTPYSPRMGMAKFDFNFIVHEGERLSISCEYRAPLFKQETIERFIGYFKDIVHAVLNDKEIKLEDISVFHDLVVARSLELEKDFNF